MAILWSLPGQAPEDSIACYTDLSLFLRLVTWSDREDPVSLHKRVTSIEKHDVRRSEMPRRKARLNSTELGLTCLVHTSVIVSQMIKALLCNGLPLCML
jgi:hypothetical protein